ncbi:MAG: hypothetical protein M3022_01805 [Actinomycetota bacterium]|nr:hypothetical protein [Actinomycetota bacterium]
MEFGIDYLPTHDAVSPGAFARLIEERGHDSLFFTEPTHLPASRDSPYAGGGELPRKYIHCHDLLDRVQELRRRADRVIPVMAMGVPADPGALEPLVEAGIVRVVHWTPSGNGAVVEAALERRETTIAQLNGEA